MAAGAGSLLVNLVLGVGVSIGCVPVERKITGLVGILLPARGLLSSLVFKLSSIGGAPIKSCRIGTILGCTRVRLLNFNLVLNIAFLILSFIIEMGVIGLIGIL